MSKARQAIGILGQYGFISATGAEAGDFLQSQLSADILALEKGKAVLTAWHNPKGRVLSCLNVVAREDEYWLALPREMTDDICAGLQRFIFRSKVRLQVATEAAMAGRVKDDERQSWFGPATQLQQQIDGFHAAGERELSDAEWELAEIRAGIPAVTPPGSGLFTGQMLNLDLIGGISFSKGCYPGQEIIARTHHLGRAKRRMHRYVSTGPARAAAEQLQDENERRAGQVVRSIGTDSGSESLVVATVQPPERLIASDGVALELAALPYPLQTAD